MHLSRKVINVSFIFEESRKMLNYKNVIKNKINDKFNVKSVNSRQNSHIKAYSCYSRIYLFYPYFNMESNNLYNHEQYYNFYDNFLDYNAGRKTV